MRPGAAVASGLTTSGPPKSLLFVPACHIQMLISRRSCPMMVEKVENALSLAISLGEMRYGNQENTSQKDRALPMTFHAPHMLCDFLFCTRYGRITALVYRENKKGDFLFTQGLGRASGVYESGSSPGAPWQVWGIRAFKGFCSAPHIMSF